jgi:hypothetical protein
MDLDGTGCRFQADCVVARGRADAARYVVHERERRTGIAPALLDAADKKAA